MLLLSLQVALEGQERQACGLLTQQEITALEWLDDVEDYQARLSSVVVAFGGAGCISDGQPAVIF
jgi:hypothetical protein